MTEYPRYVLTLAEFENLRTGYPSSDGDITKFVWRSRWHILKGVVHEGYRAPFVKWHIAVLKAPGGTNG